MGKEEPLRALRQPVEEEGDEMRLDGEPAVRRLDEVAATDATGLVREQPLIGFGAEVLDDAVGVDEVEAPVGKREAACISFDEFHVAPGRKRRAARREVQ